MAKGKVKRAKRRSTGGDLLLPGQIKRISTVLAPCGVEHGGVLRPDIKYIVVTNKLDKEWSLELEFIDVRDAPIRIKVPTAVVMTIYRHREQIVKASRRQAAEKGYATAQSRGTSGLVPFPRKES